MIYSVMSTLLISHKSGLYVPSCFRHTVTCPRHEVHVMFYIRGSCPGFLYTHSCMVSSHSSDTRHLKLPLYKM